MTVIDASVWINAARTDEPNSSISRAWAQAHTATGKLLFVPAIFALEIAGALARRNEPSHLIDAMIRDVHEGTYFRVFGLDPAFGRHAAQIARVLRIRGADAIYVALAEHLGVPLVTWDSEQRERGRQIIDVLTPSEALKRMS